MTDWEFQYQQGVTPWDKQAAHPFIAHPIWTQRSGRWLVPGCGFGNDAAALAEAGAESVLGLDVAPSAIAGAQARYGANPRLAFELTDFFAIGEDLRAGGFDGIWEHTCFCAIDPEDRPRYVAAAAAALRTGGLLVACFYLNPWDADEDQDQGPPFRSEVEKLDALFAPYFTLDQELIPPHTFPGREGKELIRFLQRNANAI